MPETSPDYIKFLRDNKILNNSGYEIYEEASKFFSTKETELKKRKFYPVLQTQRRTKKR